MQETSWQNWKRRAMWIGRFSAAGAFAFTALLVTIVERKQEARQTFYRVAELDGDTETPAIWGKNFPQHYDLWKRTVDMTRTRYGGSEAHPRSPRRARRTPNSGKPGSSSGARSFIRTWSKLRTRPASTRPRKPCACRPLRLIPAGAGRWP